ncbi:MAG: U32 family peptidase [Bacteroidales bacterium]|nr:U32 family peptidase [Bacteroidales bacterium]
MQIELLSPAKNLTQGVAAIKHGADAVYIGAPAFGARQAASNSVADIEQLVRYAHTYGVRVYVTLNTILYDSELEEAVKLIRQLYNVGIDALIIQDMGLLECDLPPIALHASTQTHNYTPEKVRFLEQVGFRRVILARETSLESMRQIRQQTSVEMEAFIHGALCVSFSGQCYLSQYLADRSGNRGCCTQPCRSKYDLYNADGKLLRSNEHLLSLRDFNASQYLESMIDAGICSFKIEGRLKDEAYVCNLTAYYRRLLDGILEQRPEHQSLSSGKTTLFFNPDPERTFSRRYTDYFLNKRQPMASFYTQKSIGKKVAKVLKVERSAIVADIYEPLSAGDGLCAYDSETGEMTGFFVNRIEGKSIFPNTMPYLKSGMELWRNHDVQFEKIFKGKSAERKVDVSLTFSDTPEGFMLHAVDSDGCEAKVLETCNKTVANNPEKVRETICAQLSKLGGTPFNAVRVDLESFHTSFIPVSVINQMRRDVVQQLIEERIKHFRPTPSERIDSKDIVYNCGPTDFRLNIVNRKAEQFYRRHGVSNIEYGVEQTHDYDQKPLMTTKYCLRYELGQCLKHKCNQQVAPDYKSDLYLENNGRRLKLRFDCTRCEMEIYKAP